MDFIMGIVVGTAFAPMWMKIYEVFIKPRLDKILGKK